MLDLPADHNCIERLPHGYILSIERAHNEPIYHSRVIKQRHCITSTTYKLQFICITKLPARGTYVIYLHRRAPRAEKSERENRTTRVCASLSLFLSAIIYHNISFITFSCCRRPLLHVHNTQRGLLLVLSSFLRRKRRDFLGVMYSREISFNTCILHFARLTIL
jgi:hypothetical protein